MQVRNLIWSLSVCIRCVVYVTWESMKQVQLNAAWQPKTSCKCGCHTKRHSRWVMWHAAERERHRREAGITIYLLVEAVNLNLIMCAAMQPQNDTMWHKHTHSHTHSLLHTVLHTHTHMQSSKSVDNVRVCERNAPAAAAEAIFLHFMQTNQLNGETYVTSYVPRPFARPLLTLLNVTNS